MRYTVYIEVANPYGAGIRAETQGTQVGTFEADSPAEAIQKAGLKGVEVLITRVPPEEKLRIRWWAETPRD
jgi:hypothetical protein